MHRVSGEVALAAGAWLCTPFALSQTPPAVQTTASEPGPEPEHQPWYKAIQVNGFAEVTYSFNFNRPDSGLNTLRVFDFDDRELKLDVAELVLQLPAACPGEIGFRVDAAVGQSVPKVSAASGLFRDVDTGEAHDYDLQQVYASWVAPLGKGVHIDAGKFVTPFGYEVIEGYDGYNDNQSRSFLFGFAIPFTHTGLRVGYSFTDAVTGTLMVVQGWDNWHDNNDKESIGLQIALTPTPAWCVYVTAMGGPEQKDDDQHDRFLYGLTSTWKPRDELTFGLDTVYGTEQGLLVGGESAAWSGAAAYFRYDLSSTFSLALRTEVFDDGDGVRTGTEQTLKGLTLTPAFKLGEHCVLRGDLRRDWSDEDVFEDHSGLAQSQTTVSAALLFLF